MPKLALIILILGGLISRYQSAPLKKPQQEASDSAIVSLGHFLFFDKHLSKNGTKSCSSCHAPELAFTDGYRRSLGAEADLQAHNAPTLLNIADYKTFHWADTTVKTLEQQVLKPLFASHPLELGLAQNDSAFLTYFNQNNRYQALFYRAFPTEKAFNYSHIIRALAAYTRSLRSQNSAYDRYRKGDTTAITRIEKRGEFLFFQQLKCGVCHPYPAFTTATMTTKAYSNIGLYLHYPAHDEGLYETTKHRSDRGKFRIRTLRNVWLTAPYMHDGSVRDLPEVIDIFAAAGRAILYGEHKGDGAKNRQKSSKITNFQLSPTEKRALLAFLTALTDTSYLKNPHFQNPHLQNAF
ncbi:MAG: hypothetical protein RI894_1474 [Bacteroidota bacterium]|jgi:cytochrome c peroxidase